MALQLELVYLLSAVTAVIILIVLYLPHPIH